MGNGRLGAMVYGNVARETIQLNEHTVWSGSPNRNDNPAALAGTTSDHEGVKGMVRFKSIARIKTEGGTLMATDTSLIVRGANAATIYLSIATSTRATF